MKKKSIILLNLIICITALAFVTACVILPRYILRNQTEKNYNTVTEVPPEFYSGPSEAVVKNASKQLSDYQKLQLISGLWESEISPASDSETNISELDAKDIAITKLIAMSSDGLYPINVDSDYQKWYSWTATAYKAVDTTFRTYAAIYWDVTFTKYDNSESHRIVVTENGDVLFANATTGTEDKSFGSFTPKLDNIGYLFINEEDNALSDNPKLSGDNTLTDDSTLSENNDITGNSSNPQIEAMLSAAESYINNLPHFDINGGVHFDITEDDSLSGAFIYGSENENYTFVLLFSDEHH